MHCYIFFPSVVQLYIKGTDILFQVIFARGLVHNWKQPIYTAFDEAMKKEKLFFGITEMENRGAKIIQIVSDMGGSNRGLWRELGVSAQRPFFEHPLDESRIIFVMADPPHLIKLVRNNLLTHGFDLPLGGQINRELFEKLHSRQGGEFKPVHKLTDLHLFCEGNDRQRVHLATQLLSHEVARFIAFLYPQLKEQSDFVQLMSDWFDTFGSRRQFDQNLLKCGYGVHLPQQEKVLIIHNVYFWAVAKNK